ncbi:MAG: hypothetical protein E7568_04050 [Ruminococcaceae bacterium]|nr:hypothetical protein [Oscillospiraceae bacterium]
MKKLLAIVMILAMMFSLIACGVLGMSAEDKVAAYVEKNRDELVSTMEESFGESSGMTCSSTIKAEGTGFVMEIRINELDNIPEDTKANLQTTYDGMNSTFVSSLETMQKELPELSYFKINVCEKDGDLLATILAEN